MTCVPYNCVKNFNKLMQINKFLFNTDSFSKYAECVSKLTEYLSMEINIRCLNISG